MCNAVRSTEYYSVIMCDPNVLYVLLVLRNRGVLLDPPKGEVSAAKNGGPNSDTRHEIILQICESDLL